MSAMAKLETKTVASASITLHLLISLEVETGQQSSRRVDNVRVRTSPSRCRDEPSAGCSVTGRRLGGTVHLRTQAIAKELSKERVTCC